jgi:hypothetical protein
VRVLILVFQQPEYLFDITAVGEKRLDCTQAVGCGFVKYEWQYQYNGQ